MSNCSGSDLHQGAMAPAVRFYAQRRGRKSGKPDRPNPVYPPGAPAASAAGAEACERMAAGGSDEHEGAAVCGDV